MCSGCVKLIMLGSLGVWSVFLINFVTFDIPYLFGISSSCFAYSILNCVVVVQVGLSRSFCVLLGLNSVFSHCHSALLSCSFSRLFDDPEASPCRWAPAFYTPPSLLDSFLPCIPRSSDFFLPCFRFSGFCRFWTFAVKILKLKRKGDVILQKSWRHNGGLNFTNCGWLNINGYQTKVDTY